MNYKYLTVARNFRVSMTCKAVLARDYTSPVKNIDSKEAFRLEPSKMLFTRRQLEIGVDCAQNLWQASCLGVRNLLYKSPCSRLTLKNYAVLPITFLCCLGVVQIKKACV